MTAAVTAAGAEDRANILVLQHIQKLAKTPLAGTGEIPIGGNNVGPELGLETKAFQLAAALLEKILFDVACGSDDPDRIPGS